MVEKVGVVMSDWLGGEHYAQMANQESRRRVLEKFRQGDGMTDFLKKPKPVRERCVKQLDGYPFTIAWRQPAVILRDCAERAAPIDNRERVP